MPRSQSAAVSSLATFGSRWGVLAVIVMLLVSRIWVSDEPPSWGHGLLIVLLWGLLAACLCGKKLVSGQAFRWGMIEWTWLALAVWMIASACWGPEGELRQQINTVWAWLGFFCTFAVLRRCVNRLQGRTLVAMMLGLAGAVASYGTYQVLVELPSKQQQFLSQEARYKADPQAMLRETGLVVPPESWETFLNRLRSPEPFATFALTNSLAGFLVPWWVVLLGLAVFPTDQRRGAVYWIAWLAWFAVVSCCLWFTHSRTAYLSAAAGAALLLAVRWIHWNKTRLVAVGLTGCILLGLLWTARQHSAFAGAKQSFTYRVEYWQSSLNLLHDHPWLGCGPGHFKDAYLAYKLPQASEEVSDPHNALLEVASTAGIPALLALLMMLTLWLYQVAPHLSNWQTEVGTEETTQSVALDMKGLGLLTLASWLGVGLGCLLGLQADLPVNGLAWLLGVLGIPLALVWLRKWIESGSLPVVIPTAAAAASLLNLQAAGGISFPAVAESFWLLLAVSLISTDTSQPETSESPKPRTAWAPALGLCAAAVGLITCYFTAYLPVVLRQAHLLAAQRSQHEDQLPLLLAAADADPWAEKPALELARWHWWQWWYFQKAEDWAGFEHWQQETLARSSKSAPVWFTLGCWFAEADKRQANEAWAKQAEAHFQQAVQHYPTSATYRGEWALALARVGKPEAGEQARQALKLNEELPHRDKKISAQLQTALEQIAESP